MTEYYTGSISQEPRFTSSINSQTNIKQLQDEIYNECLLPQFNLENLGIDYLSHLDTSISLELYERVITFISESYIHININDFIFEDILKKLFFGKSIYELFFIDIPKDDIFDFKLNIKEDMSNVNIRKYLIDYYITKTKRYESLKVINGDNKFSYLIIKNSIAANIFDTNIQEFKTKYLNILLTK